MKFTPYAKNGFRAVPISRNFDINFALTATIHGKGVGRPAIGGEFDLIDHHGKVTKGI